MKTPIVLNIDVPLSLTSFSGREIGKMKTPLVIYINHNSLPLYRYLVLFLDKTGKLQLLVLHYLTLFSNGYFILYCLFNLCPTMYYQLWKLGYWELACWVAIESGDSVRLI